MVDHKNLETLIKDANFVRAVKEAEALKLSGDKIRSLQHKALCQMSACYRNAKGTKILSQKYGYSKENLREILEDCIRNLKKQGKTKFLDICYDSVSGCYLSFEEWLRNFLKNWDKL